MRAAVTVLALGVLWLALGACGGGGPGATPAPTVTASPEATVRPFVPTPRATPTPRPTAVPTPDASAVFAGVGTPDGAPALVNATAGEMFGGIYAVRADGTQLTRLSGADNGPAGTGFGGGFGSANYGLSNDGRWLAYSPRLPYDVQPPEPQQVYLKDLLSEAPTRLVATFGYVWRLQVSSDGSRVTASASAQVPFNGGNAIDYFVDWREGRVSEVPHPDRGAGVPSPNGELIAYARFGYGAADLIIETADGQEVLHAQIAANNLVWAPDSESIVAGSGQGVYEMRLDGSISTLTLPDAYLSAGASWSPDGEWVAGSHYDEGAGKYEIQIAELATGRVSTLAEGQNPAWSYGGTQIAFVRDGRLYVADMGSGAISEVLHVQQPFAMTPRWVAGDVAIVFQYAPSFLLSISLAEADGSGAHHIAYGRDPAWSPDGSWIAFIGHSISGGLGGIDEIWVMNKHGSQMRKVVEYTWSDIGPLCATGPAWSADGESVLYFDPMHGVTMSVPADGSSEPVEAGRECPGGGPSADGFEGGEFPSPDGSAVLVVR